MVKFKVKNKHLVGGIKDFPKHIVQRMVEEQVHQGNVANPAVFADDVMNDKNNGGFTWRDTEQQHEFWNKVIYSRQFDLIPKPEKPKGHIHAKAMRKYAKDAMTNEKPWELWEMRVAESEPWKPMFASPKWQSDIEYRRKSEAVAEPKPTPALTPNALIKAMLDKGMTVWACISDSSYEDARSRLDKRIHRITEVNLGREFPVCAISSSWVYAVPVDTATMTEITELP